MEFAKSMVFALSILAFAWWIGIIMKAEGEEKLNEACYPIQFTGEAIQNLSTALVGFQPDWTLDFRRVMESGCYYFFSVVFSPKGQQSSAQSIGGLKSQQQPPAQH